MDRQTFFHLGNDQSGYSTVQYSTVEADGDWIAAELANRETSQRKYKASFSSAKQHQQVSPRRRKQKAENSNKTLEGNAGEWKKNVR